LPVFGREGLARLEAATVMVVGVGGVGSSCTEALARGGIGHLVLVDRDVVEPSNINRQALAFCSTVGRPKVDVMAEMVADINPGCVVERHHRFVAKDDLASFMAPYLGKLDYVVDAIDTVSQKLVLAELAQDAGFPLISAMGAANKLRPELLRISDISRTHTCRMSKDVRKECRRRGIRHLEVIWSSERPVAFPEGDAEGHRSALGTASFMPPIMGQMIAGHVICRIAGVEGGVDTTGEH
jgi:tRNA A37 threonylcarbamoyladenosine dehydratase